MILGCCVAWSWRSTLLLDFPNLDIIYANTLSKCTEDDDWLSHRDIGMLTDDELFTVNTQSAFVTDIDELKLIPGIGLQLHLGPAQFSAGILFRLLLAGGHDHHHHLRRDGHGMQVPNLVQRILCRIEAEVDLGAVRSYLESELDHRVCRLLD